jgi:4-hydroxy-tetrahydrodipicolinate reductase
MTVEQFRREWTTGKMGHKGLVESVHMIAHRLGWKLDRVTATWEPVVALPERVPNPGKIPEGSVLGVHQTAVGLKDGKEWIHLEFLAAVGEPRTFDRIQIDGDPPIRLEIDGGVAGDAATCALVLNSIPMVVAARPGLNTMTDLPPVAFDGRQ